MRPLIPFFLSVNYQIAEYFSQNIGYSGNQTICMFFKYQLLYLCNLKKFWVQSIATWISFRRFIPYLYSGYGALDVNWAWASCICASIQALPPSLAGVGRRKRREVSKRSSFDDRVRLMRGSNECYRWVTVTRLFACRLPFRSWLHFRAFANRCG